MGREPPFEPVADASQAFDWRLREWGLHAALRFLNLRTPHRFTGVHRFAPSRVEQVALVDRWFPGERTVTGFAPADACCAYMERTGAPLAVRDGRLEQHMDWMRASGVVSFFGVPIDDADGGRWGAIYHTDTESCDAKTSEIELLQSAARSVFLYLSRGGKFPSGGG
ncbi:GAF domain-containing protein [Ramlibacter sp.]|uniref:GAF domain-containing protein n=1 Tax=Ramlibacter sp. TaxID=1917967 RepID=UPI003D0BE135